MTGTDGHEPLLVPETDPQPLCSKIEVDPADFVFGDSESELVDIQEPKCLKSNDYFPLKNNQNKDYFLFGDSESESTDGSIRVVISDKCDDSDDSIQLKCNQEIFLNSENVACNAVSPNLSLSKASVSADISPQPKPFLSLSAAKVVDSFVPRTSQNELVRPASVMTQQDENLRHDDECSKYCKLKCRASFSTWSKECVDSLKTEFQRRTLLEKKNAVLSHVVKQNAMGIKKRGILWNSELLCTKFFSKISGISPYIVDLVLSDYIT